MHTVETLTTIDAVPAGEWDLLAGDHAFAQHRWLRLAEGLLAEHRPRYLLLRRQGRLVAAAVGALEHRLQNPRLDARFGALVRRSPFLHITVPMTATPGLLVEAGADPEPGLRALLQTIRAVVRRERYRFCILDHLPLDHPAFALQRGYCRLAWLPDTGLDVTWASFEDYLAGLPRKKRQEIKRTQRRAEREGIVVKPLTPAPEHSPALDRMVAEVVRRHGGTRQFQPDLFVKAAAALGDDLTVLAAHRHGQLVGCVALVRGGDMLDVRWIGRDYEHTADTAVYHALLTGCVQTAISAGARRLHFGAGAYESKKQFDVSLEERSRLFAARSRAVTWLMGRLGHHFEPPGLIR